MPSDARPTRQDMEKVERLAAQPAVEVDLWATATPAVKVDGVGSVRPAAESIADIKAQLGGEILDPAPICSHGRMVYKEGVTAKRHNQNTGAIPVAVRAEAINANQYGYNRDGSDRPGYLRSIAGVTGSS
jgi:hypothetical protein